MDDTYAEVGVKVILGKSLSEECWATEMDEYVGKKTQITYVGWGPDHGWCRVAIDRGVWWWCIQDMILATEKALVRKGDPRFMGR